MKMTRDKLKLDEILLDPMNPRFIDFKEYVEFPKEKFSNIQVQKQTIKLLDKYFDVKKVKDSILNNGYINVDQIVVKKYLDAQKEYKYLNFPTCKTSITPLFS